MPKRLHLELAIAAAARACDDTAVYVTGRLSILGKYPGVADELLEGDEFQVFPRSKGESAGEIEGALGLQSGFRQMHGCGARAFDPNGAVLPEGWQFRLIEVRPESTGGASGWCLDPNDLAVGEIWNAGRATSDFLRRLFEHDLIDPDLMLRGMESLPSGRERCEGALGKLLRDIRNRNIEIRNKSE